MELPGALFSNQIHYSGNCAAVTVMFNRREKMMHASNRKMDRVIRSHLNAFAHGQCILFNRTFQAQKYLHQNGLHGHFWVRGTRNFYYALN